jgi:ABC-type multidrug transport system fused ATPase/permease subunit
VALSRTPAFRAVSSHRKGGAAVRTAHLLYSVYGLTLASDVELPELTESRGEPDVFVFAAPSIERASAEPRALAFDGGGLDVVLDYPRLARLAIRGGREIAVAAAASADPAAIRALVLGPALGVLLHQRGVLALHASSVLLDRGVVAFLGRSGAGKSTMAAALHRRGHALVADDITAARLGG